MSGSRRTDEAREVLVQSIRELADQGYSKTQVGEKLDLDGSVISGLAQRAGIRFRGLPGQGPRGRAPPARAVRFRGREITCCWDGCAAPPSSPGKPYCAEHRR